MKALKEKRFSLRSLIRGGLVILSLFALVFAIGCNTSSDPDPGPGPGPGTGDTNPTVATAPYAIAILVQGEPTALSYQGLPPILTGVTVRVVWSNSAQAEFITGDKLADKGFYATANCDKATDNAADPGVGPFYIAHKGSMVFSNEFMLPGVIPLKSMAFNNSGALDWYADQRPDFAKLGLRGQYEWVADKDGKIVWNKTLDRSIALTETDPDRTKWEKVQTAQKDIPVSEGYPAMDLTKVVNGKTIKVGIGKKTSAGTPGSVNWIDNGGLFDPPAPSANSGWEYEHVESAQISKYYKVVKIEFNAPEGEFLAYDDDAKDLTNKEVENGVQKGNAAKLKKVQAAKLKFNVTYDDDKPAHTITWDDFYSNVWYTLGKEPDAEYLFLGSASVTPEPASNPNNFPVLLKPNEDTGNWNMTMQYVPKVYGDQKTYSGKVEVPLPVYEFQSLNPAKPKYPGAANLWVRYDGSFTAKTMTQLKADGDRKLLDAIKDYWTLTGQYEKGGDIRPKTLTFTEAMFDKAEPTGIKLFSSAMASNIGAISAAGIFSGSKVTIYENFPLKIRYRNDNLRDEDETVVVDIYFEF